MERISFTQSNIEHIKPPKTGRKIVWDESRRKLCVRVTENGAKTFYYVTKYKGKAEWNQLGRYPDMQPGAARVRADKKAGEYAEGRNPAQEKREEKAEWDVETAYKMYRKRNEQKGGKSVETIDPPKCDPAASQPYRLLLATIACLPIWNSEASSTHR